MSPEGTVRATHLWKRFRADRHRALLRDEVARLRARLVDRGSDAGWRYVLRDVNFTVAPGESLALVGANGSGKSTMLKILAQVMFPYAGSVETSGRVGAMIEVAAGVHPELTGRENVSLYGTILGLSKRRIEARFDEIVAFAGLEQSIDRPVKFYSSGMKMRLGFAVNAYLEPDVLIVDEVLAVGDAEFQRKCLARMAEVQQQGTTLIYVSHDLATVEAMCSRAIWLLNGEVATDGPTHDTLASYRGSLHAAQGQANAPSSITVGDVRVVGPDGGETARSFLPVTITIAVEGDVATGSRVTIGVAEGGSNPIFTLDQSMDLHSGQPIEVTIPNLPLPEGTYLIWLGIEGAHGGPGLAWTAVGVMPVEGVNLGPPLAGVVRPAPIAVEAVWS
jgi:ABC-type polysaccharide/polyol phosphate transport system ATPase subunit